MVFVRKIENFTCDNCGTFVVGDGYTNHCPSCLFSKHVDISPGDRKSSCKSLMEPIGIEMKDKEMVIIHKCTKCGEIRKCKSSPKDNFDVILRLIQRPVA